MILDRLFGTTEKMGAEHNYGGFDWSNYSSTSSSGVTVTAESAMRISIVMACVRVLSETMATLPIDVYRREPDGGKRINRKSALARLWETGPNEWQTTFEWIEMMAAHCALRGNAYSVIVPGRLGAVSELIPLHPARMKIERLSNGRLLYVYTSPDTGINEEFTQDEIHHWRWLSSDGIIGLSPVALMRDAVGLASAEETHAAALFRNGAVPRITLQTVQPLSDVSRETLRQNWERIHGGLNNTGKTAVLAHGLEAKELGMSNLDAQAVESRRFSNEEIARFFRVPLHLVGELSKSTNNNITQQSLEFVTYTILPWCRRIEAAMNRDLVVRNDEFVEFDLDELSRGDPAVRADFNQKMFYIGAFSHNDIARREGLNPLGPIGDQRFLQVNMTTIERVVNGTNTASGNAPGTPPAADPAKSGNDNSIGAPSNNMSVLDLSAMFEKTIEKLRNDWKSFPELLNVQLDRHMAAVEDNLLKKERGVESTVNEAVKLSLEIAGQQYQKMLRWEIDACRRFAKKPKEFLALTDRFYEEHEARLTDAIAAPLTLFSNLSMTACSPAEVAKTHVSESKTALLELSGTCTADNLPSRLEMLLNAWPSRTPRIKESVRIQESVQ